jgi:hypothetical protein
MFSIRKEGYAKPDDVSKDDFDYLMSTEPPTWLDDAGYMASFTKIFGRAAAIYAGLTHKVPMNFDKNYVGPGEVFEVSSIASVPSAGIPNPGEPAYVARLEKKLDAALEMLAIR